MVRVVVNYADYGLQFFTGDGTFYIELTLGVSCYSMSLAFD
jgi:hypothetical protein